MAFGKRQPEGFSGVDRRGGGREKTDVRGLIRLSTGQEVRCQVENFSATGARLSVATAFGLPDTFELHAGGGSFQVKVVRRGSGHVGVRFL